MKTRSILLTALMLGATALLGACGGDDSDDPNTPSTPPPSSELAASWQKGTISFLNFWDDQGQNMGTAGGIAIQFIFDKNGRYEFYFYDYKRNFNCTTQAWTFHKGTVSWTDTTFTVYPSQGRYKGAYSCASSSNFDRSMTDDEEQRSVQTFTWKFGQPQPPDGKTYFMVSQDNGQSWNYFQKPQQ